MADGLVHRREDSRGKEKVNGKKAILALSGGVDSTVAAYFLFTKQSERI